MFLLLFCVVFLSPHGFASPMRAQAGEVSTQLQLELGVVRVPPSPRSQFLLLLFLLPSMDTSMKGTRPGLIFVISTKSQVMGFAVWQQLVTCLDCFLENRRDAVI